MSVADKKIIMSTNNVSIAENEQKVYKAGQIKTLADTESLNGTLQGTAVKATDVAYIEHNVPCVLTSDTITDFSKIEGKNLLNPYAYDTTNEENSSLISVYNDGTIELGGRWDEEAEDIVEAWYAKYYLTLDSGTYTFTAVSNSGYDVYSPIELYINNEKVFVSNSENVESFIFELNTSTNIRIEMLKTTGGSMPCFQAQLEKGNQYTGYELYTEPRDATVTRYGKNLCNVFGYSAAKISNANTKRQLSNSQGTTISTIEADTTVTVTQTKYSDDVSYEGHYSNGMFFVGFDTSIIPVGSTVTLSFDLEVTNNPLNKSRVFVAENGKDIITSTGSAYFGNSRCFAVFPNWRPMHTTPNVGFEFRLNGISGIFSNFQLEFGNTATDYEPFKEPTTYFVSPNGTVDGITSIAPSMSLLTNAKDVIINAQYYVDPNAVYDKGRQAEYDDFWDSFQQNGNRTDYQGSFYGIGWNDTTFKPKYDINGLNLSQLFVSSRITDLEALLNECGVILDTSNSVRGDSLFYYSTISVIPELNLTKASNLASICSNCSVVTIRKIILKSDGSQTFSASFAKCSRLENIAFEGVIGQSIDFSFSPLTKASIINVIEHLSTTASGMTATFSKTAVNNAFTTDEWNTLVASRSNWTIALA